MTESSETVPLMPASPLEPTGSASRPKLLTIIFVAVVVTIALFALNTLRGDPGTETGTIGLRSASLLDVPLADSAAPAAEEIPTTAPVPFPTQVPTVAPAPTPQPTSAPQAPPLPTSPPAPTAAPVESTSEPATLSAGANEIAEQSTPAAAPTTEPIPTAAAEPNSEPTATAEPTVTVEPTPVETPTEVPTVAPTPTAEPTPAPTATTAATGMSAGQMEAYVLGEINSVRAAAGLGPLQLSGEISGIARDWSARMGAADAISHRPSDQLSSMLPAGWSRWGENVATAPDIYWAQSALEGSPGHYANMIEPSFTHVGIGVVISNGSVWVTQNFASY